jgi:dynactin 1
METVKKQADAIVDLEGDLAKARKQEKAYEEALEQLQSDLDQMGQENARLKQVTAGMEKNGILSTQYLGYIWSDILVL